MDTDMATPAEAIDYYENRARQSISTAYSLAEAGDLRVANQYLGTARNAVIDLARLARQLNEGRSVKS